jgi:hypothetical protein
MAVKKVAVLEEFTWQLPIKDKDLSSPPGSPSKGDRYIVASSGSGAWSGQTNNIALCTVGGVTPSWEFIIKVEGTICWVEDENVFYKFNGSIWTLLLPVYSRSFIIANPTLSADGPIWRVPVDITITAIHVLCIDGTNIVGQLWEYDSNGANGSTVDSSDITGTAGTNVNDDGTLSNPEIAAGNYLGWKTTSVSGAVTKVIITFEYNI